MKSHYVKISWSEPWDHQIFHPSAVSEAAQVLYKGGSRILAEGMHMSDGNAQEAQSLYVRQCIIHAFKRVKAVVW